MGKLLDKKLRNEDKVAIIEGLAAADNAQQRKRGFIKAIEEKGLRLVASEPADWETEKAAEVFQAMWMRYPDLKAVYCSNDAMALGVLQQMQEKNCYLPVVGFDNDAVMKEFLSTGKLVATAEEVIQAAKAAHVHQFVKTLPGGYDMELNEEANNVSQGQKQLLTIARAILADPKILILDEATSSVDTRTEVLIQKAMDNLMKGRTSFVIAHRLSTIRDADMILVMKDGDIVEQGNHEELLAKGGFYADLYNSQFEKTTEVA